METVNFKIGTKIELRGKTLKGKNKIQEHGQYWIIQRIIIPGSLLVSGGKDLRWVQRTNDPDFEIVGVE